MEHGVWRKAGAVYAVPVMTALVGVFVSAGIYPLSHLWSAGVFVAIVGISVLKFLSLRATVLYTTDDGVWLESGIFPWSKKTYGVKWRDIETAVYYPNFLGWLLRSHTIRINHRFTQGSEIVVTGMSRACDCVTHINNLHQELVSSGSLN